MWCIVVSPLEADLADEGRLRRVLGHVVLEAAPAGEAALALQAEVGLPRHEEVVADVRLHLGGADRVVADRADGLPMAHLQQVLQQLLHPREHVAAGLARELLGAVVRVVLVLRDEEEAALGAERKVHGGIVHRAGGGGSVDRRCGGGGGLLGRNSHWFRRLGGLESGWLLLNLRRLLLSQKEVALQAEFLSKDSHLDVRRVGRFLAQVEVGHEVLEEVLDPAEDGPHVELDFGGARHARGRRGAVSQAPLEDVRAGGEDAAVRRDQLDAALELHVAKLGGARPLAVEERREGRQAHGRRRVGHGGGVIDGGRDGTAGATPLVALWQKEPNFVDRTLSSFVFHWELRHSPLL